MSETPRLIVLAFRNGRLRRSGNRRERDAESEFELFLRLAGTAARARRTGAVTLLVSHRFSTVRMADQVIVLDGGRVAECGTHDELMARGGLYAGLYAAQAAGYQ